MAKIARIPPANVSNDDRGKLQTLDRDLKSVVFGQEPAIEALASAIKMARSGLGRPDKPIGSFLFCGPTGVGKTEVAKQLAYILGIELIRFDMSEYMERHAVSRLIGAPPGYVGFDQGGLLTEAITKKPHAVLLLDEIEKAHPDIFNVLLQVMDHGTLTDNNGRKADFRNVIIIMTTNAGAETLNKSIDRLHATRARAGDEMADIKRLFTPEFRNRLDATVSFKSLDEEIILRVVDKFLLELEEQLAEKKVEVTFTDGLRKHLAKKGFDPLMGARPMQRLIQDTIRRALADELLFGRLVEGGRLTVDVDADGKPALDIQPARQQRQAEGRAGDGLSGAGQEWGASAPLFLGAAVDPAGERGCFALACRCAAIASCLSVGRRILPEEVDQQAIQLSLLGLEFVCSDEEGLGRDGEELLDRLGAVRIQQRVLSRLHALREARMLVAEAPRPARPDAACRHAGARRVQVEHVDEFVDDDVVAPAADSPASATSLQASISGPPSIASPDSSSS